MQYQGQVIDAATGEDLQRVTLTIDGTPVGVTDQNGMFNIVTQTEGSEMTFSYVGYNPLNVPLTQVNDLFQIGLTRQDQTLPAVTITPQSAAAAASPSGPVIGQKDYTPYLIAGAAGLVLLGSTKRRGVRGVGKISSGTMLAIAAGGGLLLYLLTRPKPAPIYPAYQPAYSPAYLQAVATQNNPVAQDISAGATGVQAASGLITAISNL